MIKSEITNYLNSVKKFGGEIKTFNSNKYTGKGFIGFVDHMIIYKGYLLFIEVKIGKDKTSKKQNNFSKFLQTVCEKNPFVFYLIVNENNYTRVTELLFQQNVNGLRNFNNSIA